MCSLCSTTSGAGEYWFGEAAGPQMKRKERAELAKRNIGMVFQSYHLLDDLTVQENIDLPLSYKDIPAAAAAGHGGRHARPFPDRRQERSVIPTSFPADSSNWSASRAPSFTSRRCCWPTSRPAICTPARPRRSWSSSANSISKGTTIVQVTHSEVNAAYGSRTIQLRDGWLVGDTGNPALAANGEAVVHDEASHSVMLPRCVQLVNAQRAGNSVRRFRSASLPCHSAVAAVRSKRRAVSLGDAAFA